MAHFHSHRLAPCRGQLPQAAPDWDSLPRSNMTWAAWKTAFHAHQLTLEREKQATGEQTSR